MAHLTNVNTWNWRHILSIGLATTIFAIALTYVLGAQALLRTPQAEEGHNLLMSMLTPVRQAISGGHSSMAQMHGGGPALSDGSTMQGMSNSQMQGINSGILANNMLGSPAGTAAAGFAVVVLMSVIPLAAAAFIVSWNQRSFVVAGLLAASGVVLMILPLANMNFVIPGPMIGFVVGLAILGLGATKGIRTARVEQWIK